MALQFPETSSEEWTDGKLVIQKIQTHCKHHGKVEGVKYRFFLYGDQQTETKGIKEIFGWNAGPSGEDRAWSIQELNTVFEDWLNSIPVDLEKDARIVKSIQILFLGSHPDGVYCGRFFGSVRSQILHSLAVCIVLYMRKQTPMSNQEAESLVNSMSNLSF